VSAPKRIQMSRQKPWRADNPDAVIVARPSKWGNPFKVGVEMMTGTVSGNLVHSTLTFDRYTPDDPAGAVEAFRNCFAGPIRFAPMKVTDDERGTTLWTYTLPSDEEIRELAGKDLACWCPLDQPCHADVLLELANPTTQETTS
jgi:hypothetical protein